MRSLRIEYATKDGLIRYRAVHGRSRFRVTERPISVGHIDTAIGDIVLNCMCTCVQAKDGVCIRDVREVPWEDLGPKEALKCANI